MTNSTNDNMKKSIKILVCYHKKDKLFKDSILTPIHLGRDIAMEASKDGVISNDDLKWLQNNMIGDNTGDNISKLNREFNEATAIYWAWKNYDKLGNPDYVGLYHYRRFLHVKLKDIPNILEKNYFIAGEYYLDKSSNLYDEWINYSNDWAKDKDFLDNCFKLIYQLDKQQGISIEKFFKSGQHGPWCNMFILPKEEFFKYCEWLFNITLKIPLHGDRAIGMFIERLTSYYLYTLSKKHKVYCVNNDAIYYIKDIFRTKIFSIYKLYENKKTRVVLDFLGIKLKFKIPE